MQGCITMRTWLLSVQIKHWLACKQYCRAGVRVKLPGQIADSV